MAIDDNLGPLEQRQTFWIGDKPFTSMRAALDYYRTQHDRCPNCGSNKTGQTLAGYMLIAGRVFKDENAATCSCGWRGLVDDLKPSDAH